MDAVKPPAWRAGASAQNPITNMGQAWKVGGAKVFRHCSINWSEAEESMPWEYSQRTGELRYNGQLIARGYSGAGSGRNNPQMEQIRNVGPIPRGQYSVGHARAHATKGPVTMALNPVAHTAHGRTAFLIHGDSRDHPGAASEGCVVLPYDVRRRIAASGDSVLNVVE